MRSSTPSCRTWAAQVTAGEPYGELESVKAVSDVFSPLTGEVVEVNEALQDEPQRVNEDCYGEGWLIRVRMTAPESSASSWTPTPTRSSSTRPDPS